MVVDTLARLVAFPTVSDRPVDGIAAYLARNCSYRIDTRRLKRRTAQFVVPSSWPRSRPLPRAWWY